MPVRSGGTYTIDPKAKDKSPKQTEAPTKPHADGHGARDKDGKLIGAVDTTETPAAEAPATEKGA